MVGGHTVRIGFDRSSVVIASILGEHFDCHRDVVARQVSPVRKGARGIGVIEVV
jgi:hypothetical protein